MAWHPVTSLAALRAARPWVGASVGRLRVAIAAVGEDVFAVDDACTHAGCPFSEEASLVDGVIVCNCHGSEFDVRTGEVRHGPAELPVRTLPTRVVGDQVEVDV